ncbi:MAG TPA: L,D-transpeptidase/peptidoglycan binding protein [Solirubrobacteraceae bacterium]|nr:L,D-transpeptidase/peptidoglycan binding protein [Solirubrobacteraceae bacterium]
MDGPPRPPGYNAQRLRERDQPRPPVRRRGRRVNGGQPPPRRDPEGPARRINPLLPGILLALAVLVGTAGYLYDHARREQIAPGVRVGGVDIGGLSVTAARERLRQQLVAPLEHPVMVRAAGHTFTLTPREARLAVATDQLVGEALRTSRRGSIFTRVIDGLDGHRLNVNLSPRVTYSHAAVKHLIGRVARATGRPARNASVSPGGGGLRQVPGHDGVSVNGSLLGRQVESALVRPGGDRVLNAPMRVLHPTITTASLGRRYPAYIIIDRAAFRLRFYSHLHLADTYKIAVGRQGLETPGGLYDIQWKEVNPSWHVPNSSWAGALAGKVIPPGPQDPIKARWMAFNGGAGIHGTSDVGSLGSAASHGCIRMAIPDVIALYSRVPVGTPVFVA